MKIKTSELTGAALDWAVSVIESGHSGPEPWRVYKDPEGKGWLANRRGFTYGPSRKWEQGGPIIDVERPMLCCDTYGDGKWQASILRGPNAWTAYGPTALVAAMCCFVASKLGNEVDIPEDLLP